MTRGWRAAVWAALVAAGIALLLARADMRTDLTLFLPPAADPVQHLVLDNLRQGAAGRVVLVAIEATDTTSGARLSRGLAQALRDEPAFEGVYNGGGSAPMAGLDTLRRYRYLLSQRMDASEALSAPWLAPHFRTLHERLSGAVPVELSRARSDPTGEMAYVLDQLRPTGPERRAGVWFTGDGRALLVVRTRASSLDLDAQAAALARLRQAFGELPGAADAALALTGAPVIALESRRIIQAEVQRLSMLAVGLSLGLLVLFTRSWRFLVLGVLPLAAAVIGGMSAVVLVLGGIHGITVAFGVTLVGVVLDYPIHLFLHRHAGDSPREAIQRIRRPMWLGALTTALGFAALCFSGVSGLLQLGIFAVAGIAAAALTVQWLLPPWLGHTVPRPPPTPPRGRWAPAGALILLAVAAGYLVVDGPSWVSDIERMSPVPASMKDRDHRLREAAGLAEARDLLAVAGRSREQALQRTEAAVAALRSGEAATAMPLTDWLASAQRQRQRQAALPERATLADSVEEAVAGIPLRASAFEPFIDDVAASRDLAPLRPEGLEQRLASLVGQRLTHAQGHWWSLVPLRDVADRAGLANLAEAQNGVHYLDIKARTGELLSAYRERSLWHFAAGSVVIMLCLLAALGWRWRMARIAVVAFGGVLVAVAALALVGAPMSVFSLVSLLLVAGLGLDYAVFTSETSNPSQSLSSATVCALSTVLAFGVLGTAEVTVLADIGRTVATGAAAAWLLAWLLSESRTA